MNMLFIPSHRGNKCVSWTGGAGVTDNKVLPRNRFVQPTAADLLLIDVHHQGHAQNKTQLPQNFYLIMLF